MLSDGNMPDVSFVVPAYNAAPTIAATLTSLLTQDYSGRIRVIVVNDGSTDATARIVSHFAEVDLVSVANGGPARATNVGVERAEGDIVVSVDADAVLAPDWLGLVLPWFARPDVGAASGYVATGNTDAIGKIAGYWSEYQHRRVGTFVDNLGSANTAYRKAAIEAAGMFDESLHAGYDTVISRRLVRDGWKLVREKRARCVHYWRTTLRGYLWQQSTYAYYRAEIMRRFGSANNDGLGVGLFVRFGLVVALAGTCLLLVWHHPLALVFVVALPLVHVPEAVGMARLAGDVRLAVLGPPVLVLRDMAWVWGLGRYVVHLLRPRR